MSKPKQEEFEMFLMFEMTPDLVCIAGKDGFFRKINRAVVDTLEYSQEELFSKPPDRLADDRRVKWSVPPDVDCRLDHQRSAYYQPAVHLLS